MTRTEVVGGVLGTVLGGLFLAFLITIGVSSCGPADVADVGVEGRFSIRRSPITDDCYHIYRDPNHGDVTFLGVVDCNLLEIGK